jgi:hypothetical protein
MSVMRILLVTKYPARRYQAGALSRLRADLPSAAGAQLDPLQQFSVKKPISAFIVS